MKFYFIGQPWVVVFKWCSTIIPAIGALYTALSGAWNLPYAEPVTASCAAVTAFLMTAVGFSKSPYVDDTEDTEAKG